MSHPVNTEILENTMEQLEEETIKARVHSRMLRAHYRKIDQLFEKLLEVL